MKLIKNKQQNPRVMLTGLEKTFYWEREKLNPKKKHISVNIEAIEQGPKCTELSRKFSSSSLVLKSPSSSEPGKRSPKSHHRCRNLPSVFGTDAPPARRGGSAPDTADPSFAVFSGQVYV